MRRNICGGVGRALAPAAKGEGAGCHPAARPMHPACGRGTAIALVGVGCLNSA